MFNKLVSWCLVIIWMSIIFWLSDQPKLLPPIHHLYSLVVTSIGHIVFYAILYILSFRAIGKSFSISSQFVNLLSLLIVILYGISDEYHQSFVPGRTPDILDVVLDSIGGLIASIINKKITKP